MPADQIAAAAAAGRDGGEGETGVEVWPQNWPAVRLFLAVETQWRVGFGFGVVAHLGLDYAAVEAAMRMMRIEAGDTVFDDLRALERAALPILNEA